MPGILREVRDREGAFDVDVLGDKSDADARAWLTSLPGVGPKTAAVVLSFAFGRDTLPVDTHVHHAQIFPDSLTSLRLRGSHIRLRQESQSPHGDHPSWVDDERRSLTLRPLTRAGQCAIDSSPGSGHLFADSSLDDYNEQAAGLLKDRTLAFLHRVG